jgi:hypothetical protein
MPYAVSRICVLIIHSLSPAVSGDGVSVNHVVSESTAIFFLAPFI